MKKNGSFQIYTHSLNISAEAFLQFQWTTQWHARSAESEEEPIPELIEPEFIEVKASKQGRKLKANYDEMHCNRLCLPCLQRCGRSTVYQGWRSHCPDTRWLRLIIPYITHHVWKDALLLYRLEKEFEFLGVSLCRTTMASWIITCSQNYLNAATRQRNCLICRFINAARRIWSWSWKASFAGWMCGTKKREATWRMQWLIYESERTCWLGRKNWLFSDNQFLWMWVWSFISW